LKELTALTGKTIDNWEEDAMTIKDETDLSDAQYARMMPELKKEMERENNSPTGILLVSAILIGGAGWMRWKRNCLMAVGYTVLAAVPFLRNCFKKTRSFIYCGFF
jgi:hypothetical protein